MTTIDAIALEQVLESIDLTIGATRRLRLAPGELLPLAPGAALLAYVTEGIVQGVPIGASGCALDVDPQSRTVAMRRFGDTDLHDGDVFVTFGRDAFVLDAPHGAELMLIDLQLAESTAPVSAALPAFVSVFGFAELEPAAAALATNMGHIETPVGVRSGDNLICRMMAKTLLLSAIRAWAENGCAPQGWPSLSTDPFLDRVVEAIHEAPGRDWTVESLASIGAMSRSVFAERFRATVGRSPANYVTEVRMDAAKAMLDAGRSVSAISRELGYASDEGFSRAFRRHTGITPSTWRTNRRALVSA